MTDNEPLEDENVELTSLNDEDLTAQMDGDLYDGLADGGAEGTNLLPARGWSPAQVLLKGVVEGMRVVG
ncbi:MAG: cobalamin-binding protein, partial [Actinomycetia bacterium]|nr:cobalamin-binding protein [Actinomycetes bacterium]